MSPDVMTYSAAISAGEKSEQLQQAHSLLAEMGSAIELLNVFMCSAAISAYEQIGFYLQYCYQRV